MHDTLTDTKAIDEEIKSLDMEIEVVNGLIRKSIMENATVYKDGRIVFKFINGAEIEA